MHTLLVKEAANERNELEQSCLACKSGGMELLVKERTVGGDTVVKLGYGVCRRRRTAHVSARCGTDTVRDRRVSKTSVGRCSRLRAERHVCGYGVQTCVVDTATGVGVLLYFLGIGVSDLTRKEVGFLVVVTVLLNGTDELVDFLVACALLLGQIVARAYGFVDGLDDGVRDLDARLCKCACDLDGHLLGTLARKALTEVCRHRFLVFAKRNKLLLINQLTDRKKCVGHIGDTEALGTRKVVTGAALFDCLTAGKTTVHHRGLEGEGATNTVRNVNGVVGVDHQLDEIRFLLLVGVKELFKGVELAKLARARTDLHTLVHTVGEYELHRAAHIEECRVVPAVGCVGRLRLNASDDGIVARFLKRKSAGHKRGDDDLVVVVCGNAVAKTRQVRRLQKKLLGRAVPYADRERGLRQTDVDGCFKTHIGQVVGGVHTIFVLTADDEVLEHTVSCEACGGLGVTHLAQAVELDPNAVDQLLCLLVGDLTRVKVSLVEGIHILVEATGGDGVTAALRLDEKLNEPEGLASLVEGACAVIRHVAADLGDLKKLLAANAIALGGGKTLCLVCVARGKISCGVTALDDRLDEVGALHIVAVTRFDGGKRRKRFLLDALVADAEHLTVIHGDMTHAVIEVVTDGEDTVVHKDVVRLGGHQGCRELARGLTLPIGMDGAQCFLGLFGDVEGVCLTRFNGVKFCFQPFPGILGEGGAAAGVLGIDTHDQLAAANDDGKTCKDVGECRTAAADRRKRLRCLVALGQKDRAVGFDLRKIAENIGNEHRDARTLFRGKAGGLMHHSFILLSIPIPLGGTLFFLDYSCSQSSLWGAAMTVVA